MRGTATCNSIEALTVNGITATTSDSFANWQAVINLQPGQNTISAVSNEADQIYNLDLAVIESNELINSPTQMIMNADGSIVYAIDTGRRQIVKLNIATGTRTVLSSTVYPNQDLYFGNMGGIALNEAEGILYIGSRYVNGSSPSGKAWILAVDIDTGIRSIISDPASVIYTTLMQGVDDLVYDATNKKLYATDDEEIYQIELDTNNTPGEQVLISSPTVPNANNPIPAPHNLSIELDISNERLLVLDQGSGSNPPQLIAMSLNSLSLGERTIISNAASNDASWDSPVAITMTASNIAYVLDHRHSEGDDIDIIKIDLTSGNRYVYANGSFGGEKEFTNQVDMTFDNSRQQLIISNKNSKAIFTVSLSDFERKTLAYNLNPKIVGNTNLGDLSYSAIDSDTGLLYFRQEKTDIMSMNLSTGKRTALAEASSEIGQSTYSIITGMSFDMINKKVVINGNVNSDSFIRTYDTTTGTESIITDDATGTGDDLNNISAWVSLDENTAIIADNTNSPGKYYSLDMTTGNRTLINVDYSGVPVNLRIEAMAISADKKTLYIVDDNDNAGLYALDLEANTFTTITNNTLPIDGNDFRLSDPESIAVSSDGAYVYVGDNNNAYIIKVNVTTGERQRIIGDVITSTNSWAERTQGISVDRNKQIIYTTDESTDAILMIDEVSNDWVMIAE